MFRSRTHLPLPLVRFVLSRVGQAVLLLFGLVTAVFFLSRLLPGDPASIFLAPSVPPELAQQLRKEFGLDKPIGEQYLLWLGSVVRGQWGFSFTHQASVGNVLVEIFPNTLLLGTTALCIEIVLALVLVRSAALNYGSRFDRFLSRSTLVVYTVPSFLTGMMLLWLFSYKLGIFPSSQMHSVADSTSGAEAVGDLLLHLALPALTAAIPGAAGLARYLRSNIESSLNQDFVLAARGMGLSKRTVFNKYVLPNSIGPMISLAGVELGVLLTGVLVTESIFAWPGIGRVTVTAVFARDYPMILGCTMLTGCLVIAGSFLADLVNAAIDPRIRLTDAQ